MQEKSTKSGRKTALLSRRAFLQGSAGATLSLTCINLGCDEADDDDDNGNPIGDTGDPVAQVTERGPASGKVQLSEPRVVLADSLHTWTLTYTAGPEGLQPGATIALCVEHGADWGEAVTLYGKRNKYGGLGVDTDADAELVIDRSSTGSSGNAIRVRVEAGEVKPGERIVITIGDIAGDEPGLLKAPSVAHDATIKVMENLHGERDERNFLYYTAIEPAEVVRVTPRETVCVDALAKSRAVPGEPVSLLVRAEDEFGNITPDFAGVFDIYDDRDDSLLGSLSLTSADEGWAYAEGICIAQAGVARLRVVQQDGDLTAFSDPIEITDDKAVPPMLWGQMHGHSLVSDGLGSDADYYDYARHRSNLDFCALTDHGVLVEDVMNHCFFRHYIDEAAWNAYAATTRAKNEPGAFTTFLAYEWTSNLFNDKNVYFFHDDEPWQPYPLTVDKLYDLYRGRQVMIISHMMWASPFMRAINWDNFDNELERVVEVSSVHGAREYAFNPYNPEDEWMNKMGLLMAGHLVYDGLAKGHRLGITCGADTHTGCPGNSICGIHGSRVAGLTAMRSADNTRAAIWDRLYNRRVYGTTGPRILLDFSFGGAPMGSELDLPPAGPRTFAVTAYGKRGIERIELIRDDPTDPVDALVFDPPAWDVGEVTLTDAAPPAGPAFYYVRVIQHDGEVAWSSPIWLG